MCVSVGVFVGLGVGVWARPGVFVGLGVGVDVSVPVFVGCAVAVSITVGVEVGRDGTHSQPESSGFGMQTSPGLGHVPPHIFGAMKSHPGVALGDGVGVHVGAGWGQPLRAFRTARMISLTSMVRSLLASPARHADTGMFPSAMFTMTMISLIVTTPSPLQSPVHTLVHGAAVGLAVAVGGRGSMGCGVGVGVAGSPSIGGEGFWIKVAVAGIGVFGVLVAVAVGVLPSSGGLGMLICVAVAASVGFGV